MSRNHMETTPRLVSAQRNHEVEIYHDTKREYTSWPYFLVIRRDALTTELYFQANLSFSFSADARIVKTMQTKQEYTNNIRIKTQICEGLKTHSYL